MSDNAGNKNNADIFGATHVIGRLWTLSPVTVDDVSYSVPIAEGESGLWVDASEFLLGLGYNKNTLTQSVYSIINNNNFVQDADYTIFQIYEDDIVPVNKYAFNIEASIAICKANTKNETTKAAIPFLEQSRDIIKSKLNNESILLNAFILLDVMFPLDVLANCMRKNGYNDKCVSKDSLLAMFASDGLLSKRKNGYAVRNGTQRLFCKINNEIMCTPHGFNYMLRKYAGLTSVRACAETASYGRQASLLKSYSVFERERLLQ
jgi:phage anti-repressor protein